MTESHTLSPGSKFVMKRFASGIRADDRTRRIWKRVRALRSEFSEDEWSLISELANHPNRLLVTATTEAGDIYAEVVHEAIFRRWENLRDWIAAEREFLAWRTNLEGARRTWETVPLQSRARAARRFFACAGGSLPRTAPRRRAGRYTAGQRVAVGLPDRGTDSFVTEGGRKPPLLSAEDLELY